MCRNHVRLGWSIITDCMSCLLTVKLSMAENMTEPALSLPDGNVNESSPHSTAFDALVREQGGNGQFMAILAKHVFTSGLSLETSALILQKQRN